MPKIRRFPLLLAALCAAVLVADAQTSMGTITGSVTDASNSNVPDVIVRVKNADTGVTAQTSTSSGGVFNVTALIPGDYTVEAEKAGFDKTLVQSVTVLASQTTTVDIHLQVGKVASTVDVTDEAPLLIPSSQAVSTTVEQNLAQNLPYMERSTLGAAMLVPGVRGDPASPNQIIPENPVITTGAVLPASFLSVGGAWPGRTSILVDGSDVTQASYPRAGISVSGEMIQELTVISSGLPAQYGRSQGGVIIQATRSGGGGFHGSATWRHTDPFFEARQMGQTLPPASHNNYYGGYVGGPVVIPHVYNGRNKTFFYVGVEPARLSNTTSAQGVVPTPDELAGHLNNSYALINQTILKSQGVDAAMAAPRVGYLAYPYPVNAQGFPDGPQYSSTSQYVPIPNNDVSRQLAANKFASFVMAHLPTPQNPGPYLSFIRPDGLWNTLGNNVNYERGVSNVDNRYSMRFDHAFSDHDRFFVRYTDEPLTSTRFFALAQDNPLTQVPVDDAWSNDVSANEVHIFNAGLVNEVRVNYMRDRQLRSENSADLSQDWAGSLGLTPATSGVGFPASNFGFTTQIGNSGGSSQVDENFQVADDVTWTRGIHTIKFGGDYRAIQSNQYNLAGVYGGTYGFSGSLNGQGGSGGSTLVTMDLGLIATYTNTPVPTPAYYRWKYYAGYVQDDVRLASNLTLNLGMRWEVETPRSEKYNNQGSFIPSLTGTLNGLPATGAFCFSGACGLNKTLWPTNYHGFEPRLGIAWVPRRFMTVRAAYDILRAPITGNGNTPVPDFNVSSQSVGGVTGGVIPNSAVDFITNPVAPLTSVFAGLSGRGPFFTMPAGFTVPYVNQSNETPYSQQWNVTVQLQVKPNTMLELSYHGLSGTHLISRFAPPKNIPSLNTLDTLIAQKFNFSGTIAANPYNLTQNGVELTQTKMQSLMPYQNFFNQVLAEIYNRDGKSIYHAFYAHLNHRFSHGVSFISSFSWSKTIDDFGGDNNTGNSGVIGATQVQNPFSLESDRSVANFDIPVSFTTGFSWNLPVGQNQLLSTKNKVLDLIVGNWVTSGIYNVQEGYPFYATLGNGTGNAGYFSSVGGGSALPTGFNLRPDVVPGQQCINPNWRNDPQYTNYINPAYFSMPGAVGAPQFGDAPATLGACRSPRTETFDASAHKKIPLGKNEKRYLEIGLHAIDALNHPAFYLNLNSGHYLYSNNSNPATTPSVVAATTFGYLGITNTLARTAFLSAKVYF
jgi:hypothetical protein